MEMNICSTFIFNPVSEDVNFVLFRKPAGQLRHVAAVAARPMIVMHKEGDFQGAQAGCAPRPRIASGRKLLASSARVTTRTGKSWDATALDAVS